MFSTVYKNKTERLLWALRGADEGDFKCIKSYWWKVEMILASEDGRRWKRIQDDSVSLSNKHLLNSSHVHSAQVLQLWLVIYRNTRQTWQIPAGLNNFV